MNRSSHLLVLGIALALGVMLSGCTTVGVKVWERDILATPYMQPDRHSIERELDDHIYFSKEGSSGGRGFGGGGCGCN